tara:strand:- start:218 stop:319 length:102 start_codon:yes stop_codon:yes gene_type:complete
MLERFNAWLIKVLKINVSPPVNYLGGKRLEDER